MVDPRQATARDRVFFGATVGYVGEAGVVRRVTLVGADEADLSRGEVSLAAPIARALLGARVGDRVIVAGPGREAPVEVVSIDYPA